MAHNSYRLLITGLRTKCEEQLTDIVSQLIFQHKRNGIQDFAIGFGWQVYLTQTHVCAWYQYQRFTQPGTFGEAGQCAGVRQFATGDYILVLR